MDKDFKKLKQQTNKVIEANKTELEKIKNEFIESVVPFAVTWIENRAEWEAVKRHSEITKKLGQKLGDFKGEIKELIKSVTESTKKEFSKKHHWVHYGSLDRGSDYFKYRFDGNRAPEILDKGVRFIIGGLGPILKKYGYLESEKFGLDEWSERSDNGDKMPGGRSYYSFGFDWTQKMRDISERYAEKSEELKKLYSKLEDLLKEEKQSNAKKLWESS